MNKALLEKAKKLPSLGIGGIAVYKQLIEYATDVKEDEAIIDIGSWLGSTTAFLMLASKAEIHCFDKWEADEIFRRKAKKAHGIDFDLGQDILPTFKKNVKPFGNMPVFHKGDFLKATFESERKIPLIVDDICTGKEMTDHLFDLFEDKMIPGRTIILMMDYWFFQHRSESCRLYQHDMMEINMNHGVFESLGRPEDSRCQIFRYMGGEIKRLSGSRYLERVKGQGYIK